MNKFYKEILDNLSYQKESLHAHSRVLLVDSLNTFIRSFAVINHMNPSGAHIGGLSGYLKSVGAAIKTIRPTRVILVFDGLGGSTNKRLLYPEYKANRHISKITNWEMFDGMDDESESITSQIIRLIQYLKTLPVDLLSIDKIEADDVIGYISQQIDGNVYIMSTDKDYLQLVRNNIYVYNPTKKKVYDVVSVKQEYLVSPANYLMFKILCGDSGDNVPGINGLGVKTLVKLFPELKDDTKYTLEYILSKCLESLNKNKLYSRIAAYHAQLRINERLMDLTSPFIPEDSLIEINNLLRDPKKTMDIKEFITMYNEDILGKSISNPQMWVREVFEGLTHYTLKD